MPTRLIVIITRKFGSISKLSLSRSMSQLFVQTELCAISMLIFIVIMYLRCLIATRALIELRRKRPYIKQVKLGCNMCVSTRQNELNKGVSIPCYVALAECVSSLDLYQISSFFFLNSVKDCLGVLRLWGCSGLK